MSTTNIKSLTKVELIQIIDKQSTEVAALRAKVSEQSVLIEALRAERDELMVRGAQQRVEAMTAEFFDKRYPLVDSRGRHYRMEGQVKCFPPSGQ